ncbi:pyridoxal-dependent decarboxylase [Actinacidiphila glaucinigra]|uniref:L-histidine carboxy-lyase (Histamine-forming) n=1 Tax=Actinacidiphila glaucinigra TaxID=235986 RepID=A0A239LV35_9ACTN|nr:pyridoxal-dependent decarboxylase [Actinacidiphila glaucinigra]SNT34110.1 L-histidine carboxy-lyase (histamine-forming) [Actinacidiphila glaucinigra]
MTTLHTPAAGFDRVTLGIGALPHDVDRDALHLLDLVARLKSESPRILGYPGNRAFDYSFLAPALAVIPNNVGDPDSSDPDDITHTKPYEAAVVRFLTDVAHGDPQRTYGYMTASSTEGILFGLHIARRRLPRAPIYVSDQAHFSIRKCADLLRAELVTIPSRPDGSMDPDALHVACLSRRRRDLLTGRMSPRGAIVLATIGTTMTGALDNPIALRAMAAAAGEVHVHADAALGGLLAAYAPTPRPWDFSAGVDSLQMSMHKLLGSPVPGGVVLARADLVPAQKAGAYVGSVSDRTLSCSRSGLAPLIAWHGLRRLGEAGLCARVRRCQETAAYAINRLQELGWRAWRADPSSITVVFDRPAQAVVDRWHLSCDEAGRCHLVTVPHVTRHSINALCDDLGPTQFATNSRAARLVDNRI